jgi:geranylgeranyl diphosphate synthase type II
MSKPAAASATILPDGPVAVMSPTPIDHAPGGLPGAVSAPTGKIEAFLEKAVRDAGLAPNLTDAILYSLLGPGKRARPLLAWHSYFAIAGASAAPEVMLPGAAAVELVHAFSLAHDDLPGLDNDDLRRGRPTLHRHTSEAMAVLAGDAMLTLAFQVISQRAPGVLAGPQCAELAIATNAMISGQVYDTLGGYGVELTPKAKLELIHRNKTGALIRVACRLGGLAALHAENANIDDHEPRLKAITRYAEAIGLMFQIVDDLLDVTQSTEHLGKKSGKDQEAGKLTYPGVFGIEYSRNEVARLHTEALDALAKLGPAAEPLRQLAAYLAVRTK